MCGEDKKKAVYAEDLIGVEVVIGEKMEEDEEQREKRKRRENRVV